MNRRRSTKAPFTETGLADIKKLTRASDEHFRKSDYRVGSTEEPADAMHIHPTPSR
jgi:hypothetical protein